MKRLPWPERLTASPASRRLMGPCIETSID